MFYHGHNLFGIPPQYQAILRAFIDGRLTLNNSGIGPAPPGSQPQQPAPGTYPSPPTPLPFTFPNPYPQPRSPFRWE